MPLARRGILPPTARHTAVDPAQTHRVRLQYRPDLDGLRAVAVLSVIAFHAGFGCPGGYVGVDVFFVLSGFLIGSIVRDRIDRGEFSLLDFWERRIRRLAAALFVVIGFVVAAGWYVLLPKDFAELGQSIVAQSLFLANVYFWREAGYFAGPSELKPLLHLWSLAVEEQFYFVLPPLLVLLQKVRRRGVLAILSGLTLASFAWCLRATIQSPDAAFFLLPARAWEMLLGVLATFVVDRFRTDVPRPVAEVVAGLGLASIIVAIAAYSRTTPFPGYAAALPCLGTTAVILGNSPGATLVCRLLSARPFVLIGVISYSLYLWHWPLLSMLAYLIVGPPSLMARTVCVVAAFALATASYRVIEQPIRAAHVLPSRGRLFAAAAISVALLAACGVTLHLAAGFNARFTPQSLAFLDVPRPDRHLMSRTRRDSAAELRTRGYGWVFPTDAGRAPVLAILGDSHAIALLPVVERMSREFNVPTIAATRPATIPLLSLDPAMDPDKREFQRLAFNELLESGAHHVLLVGRWSAYADELTSECLARTIQLLHTRGMQVWILRQVPEQRDDVPRSLALARFWDWNADAVSTTLTDYGIAQRNADLVFNTAAAADGVRVLDVGAVFFSGSDRCRVQSEGQPLYADDDHLSQIGAYELTSVLLPLYESAAVTTP